MKNAPYFKSPDSGGNICGYCQESTGGVLFSLVDTNGNRWNWSQCPACGARSITPRPTPEQLAAAYDASYYGAGKTKFVGPVERFVNYVNGLRAKKTARGIPARANVLDVGCGSGDFLAALGKCGDFGLYGVELPGGSAERAAMRKNINLTVGTIADANYAPEYFDLITMCHVFEHLTEPRKTLEIVHRVLKPDGRFVLSVPNISSVQAKIFGPNWLHLDPPRHLFLMPEESFDKAARELGFVIVGRRYFSLKQNPYGFIQSMLNCLFAQRDILYERLKGNKIYAPAHGKASIAFQMAAAAVLFPLAFTLDVFESAFNRGATVEYTLRKLG